MRRHPAAAARPRPDRVVDIAAGPALVDGTAGVVVARHGRLVLALAFTVRDGRITGYDVIADPGRLRQLDLAVLGQGG
jgi:hypothetical protein